MSKPAAALYHRYLKLCNTWGVDVTKPGRELGGFLRDRLSCEFKQGEFTQIPVAEFAKRERELQSLETLARNAYWKPLLAKQSSSTGATLEESRNAISGQAISHLKQLEESGFIDRLKHQLDQIKFQRSTPEATKKE